MLKISVEIPICKDSTTLEITESNYKTNRKKIADRLKSLQKKANKLETAIAQLDGLFNKDVTGVTLVTNDITAIVKELIDKPDNEKLILETYSKLSTTDKDEFIYELIKEGYTQKEIAILLHTTQSTISKRVNRYKKTLEEEI